MVCGVHGHDLLLHLESQRICLQCTSCGYQTAGWQVATSRRLAK
jgi:hypothetical protein